MFAIPVRLLDIHARITMYECKCLWIYVYTQQPKKKKWFSLLTETTVMLLQLLYSAKVHDFMYTRSNKKIILVLFTYWNDCAVIITSVCPCHNHSLWVQMVMNLCILAYNCVCAHPCLYTYMYISRWFGARLSFKWLYVSFAEYKSLL